LNSSGLARYGRPVIIALLLVTVVAGIRAAGPAVAGRGPWRQDWLAIGVSLEIALAGLQIVLAVRTRRAPAAGHLVGTLRTVLRYLTLCAMITIIVIAAVNLVLARSGHLVLEPPRHQHAARPYRLGAPGALKAAIRDDSYILYTVIALIVVAAIVICAVVISRMRRGMPGGYVVPIADDDSAELHKAVESGRTALRAVDDARAAIIACYVAMEGSLAGAGAARTAAETPDELLARAVASGLIHGSAAGQLTALFYEARFSSHPLADAAKDDARQALDAISAELRSHRVAARPSESAQAGSSQPGSSQPGSSQPGSSQPGSSQPGSSQPGSSQHSRPTGPAQ
jgi:hypothetical protein